MSIATVSKALNNDPSIGHYTRERVLRLAQARNYVPNETARNFQRQKSRTVGLTVPNTLDQFFVQAINGVDDVALEARYSIVILQTLDDDARAGAILDLVLSDRLDGLIATITPNTTDLTPYRRLESAGIPVVYMNRSPHDPACPLVTGRNADGAALATQFLLDRGHRRLAHLKGPDNIMASRQRLAGFEQALRQRGLPVIPQFVREVDLSPASTDAAMRFLMAQPNYPTGILTFKNYVTLDAIDFLKRKYPERLDNIDFVGFGNLPLIRYLEHKPVASIEENAGQMGREAMRLLLRLIEATSTGATPAPEHIEIPGALVIHD